MPSVLLPHRKSEWILTEKSKIASKMTTATQPIKINNKYFHQSFIFSLQRANLAKHISTLSDPTKSYVIWLVGGAKASFEWNLHEESEEKQKHTLGFLPSFSSVFLRRGPSMVTLPASLHPWQELAPLMGPNKTHCEQVKWSLLLNSNCPKQLIIRQADANITDIILLMKTDLKSSVFHRQSGNFGKYV